MDLMRYAAQAPFAQRHLLTLQDWSEDEILQSLSLALRLKADLKAGLRPTPLAGKTLAMIFAKSSTRTRVSFEVGARQLGADALFLSTADIQLGRGEPISDTARVLSRMVDGIMIRTFAQADLEQLALHGSIPVINGLTDEFHPCQILADLLTVYEHKGKLKGLKVAFIGDGNNMAHSMLIGCSKLGIDVAVASPAGYAPKARYVAWAQENAQAHGSLVRVTEDRPKRSAARMSYARTCGPAWARRPRRRRAARHLPAIRWTRRCWPAQGRMRSSCTACRRTAAKRSRQASSTARSRSCSTRRRTVCTRRRPSWHC